jgi:hypothetical protein
MRRLLTNFLKTRRAHSSNSYEHVSLPGVPVVHKTFDQIDVDEFRRRAFIPEEPLLMKGSSSFSQRPCSIPAAIKWFDEMPSSSRKIVLSQSYLAPFGATILPYELVFDRCQPLTKYRNDGGNNDLTSTLEKLVEGSHGTFHRFNAPLSVFLHACSELPTSSAYRLYIAQAQIADLPLQLQNDLPTPTLVKEAGKGDIYDANIWIGRPPTYTPLHKDPNPNLFIQLASSKLVRIFRPDIGASLLRNIQQRIGQSSPSTFRGEEMMEGPERDTLDEAVWGQCSSDGFEATVSPGDALFIPKGWWHSIKSQGTDVTASVNWWFR